MNEKEAEESATFSINLCAAQDLPLDQQNCFNGGYLFLQEIYYELGLDRICRAIALRHRFSYNLNSILSRLVYARILYPSSKKSALEESKRFIEQPSFELHDIHRALSIIAEESDYIQSRLFQNSCRISSRKTAVIYYDCTNFYFEIEKAEEDKQYGVSKENRPLPIVEMGLFMDQEGIPPCFRYFCRKYQRTEYTDSSGKEADGPVLSVKVCDLYGFRSLVCHQPILQQPGNDRQRKPRLYYHTVC